MLIDYFPLNPYDEDSQNVKVNIKKNKFNIFEVRKYDSKDLMYTINVDDFNRIKKLQKLDFKDPNFSKTPFLKKMIKVQSDYNKNLVKIKNDPFFLDKPYNSEILRRRSMHDKPPIRLSKSENNSINYLSKLSYDANEFENKNEILN